MSHSVLLGSSFARSQTDHPTKYYNLKYSQKPKSLDPAQPGTLSYHPTLANTVLATFKSTPAPGGGGAPPVHQFSGTEVASKDVDCVLVWDDEKQSYILERLSSVLRLSHDRVPLPVPLSTSSTPSPRTRTNDDASSDSSADEAIHVPSVPPARLGNLGGKRTARPLAAGIAEVEDFGNVSASSASGRSKPTLPPPAPVPSSAAHKSPSTAARSSPHPSIASKGPSRSSPAVVSPSVPKRSAPAPPPTLASKRPASLSSSSKAPETSSKSPSKTVLSSPKKRRRSSVGQPPSHPNSSVRPHQGMKTLPPHASAGISSGSDDESGSESGSEEEEEEDDESGPEGYLAVPGSVLSRRVGIETQPQRDEESDSASASGSDLEDLESLVNAQLIGGSGSGTRTASGMGTGAGRVSGKSVVATNQRTATQSQTMDRQGNMSFNRMLGSGYDAAQRQQQERDADVPDSSEED